MWPTNWGMILLEDESLTLLCMCSAEVNKINRTNSASIACVKVGMAGSRNVSSQYRKRTDPSKIFFSLFAQRVLWRKHPSWKLLSWVEERKEKVLSAVLWNLHPALHARHHPFFPADDSVLQASLWRRASGTVFLNWGPFSFLIAQHFAFSLGHVANL